MKTLTKEQILQDFKNAGIEIHEVEKKKPQDPNICTIYRGLPVYFSTYYSAWSCYDRKKVFTK